MRHSSHRFALVVSLVAASVLSLPTAAGAAPATLPVVPPAIANPHPPVATTTTIDEALSPLAVGGVRFPRQRARTTPDGGRVTIRPLVRPTPRTVVLATRIGVRRGGEVLARARHAVRLPSGRYHLTTTARYRFWRWTNRTITVTDVEVGVAARTATPVSCLAVTTGRTADPEVVEVRAECRGGAFDGVVPLTVPLVRGAGATPDEQAWSGSDATADSTDSTDATDIATAGTAGATTLTAPAPPTAGAWFDAVLVPGGDLLRTVTRARVVRERRWSAVQTRRATQTLVIRAGRRILPNGESARTMTTTNR